MARLRLLRLFPGVTLAAGAVALAALAGGSPPEPDAGVVIEKVPPGSIARQADLRPGDILLAWQRAPTPPANPRPAAGTLRSPFDLVQVLIEQLPRGGLTLSGRRGWRERTWFLPGGSEASLWQDLETRPSFSRQALDRYQQGKDAWALDKAEAGDARWRTLAARADPVVATWLLARRAEAWSRIERWDQVDSLYGRAIAPLESRGSPVAAQLLRSWGMKSLFHESWAQARDCFERALKIDRRLAPQSLAETWSLRGLGYTASWSAGARNPEDFLYEALDLRRRLAPGSSEVAMSWYDLGADAESNQDYSLAEKRYRRALALQEILTPAGTSFTTDLLVAIGLARFPQKDFPAAEELLQRALALAERQGIEEVKALESHQALGRIAEWRGNHSIALNHLKSALELAEKLQPAGWRTAEVLHDLGRAERRAGRLQQSAEHLCRTLEIGEQQRRKWRRNDEERRRWSRTFVEQYRACAEALFHLGRASESFQTWERGRAHSFLSLLAERRLRSSELPPELAVKWSQLAAEYDRVYAELERVGEASENARPLRGNLREISRQQNDLLKAPSPSLADLRTSEPVDLAGAQQALDPGTVLLSYSVGRDETLLFVVEPEPAGGPGLHAFSLPVGREALRENVRQFREMLKNSDLRRLGRPAQSLYELLLRPAEPWLAKSERILICPDDALHALPFAALVREGSYLIEWRPLHMALSATAYWELSRRASPRTGGLRIAAFGDPLPKARGKIEGPLPASRREIEGIAALFLQTRIFRGPEATEGKVKQVAAEVDILHLAVHATLDERLPLNSALLLSPPPSLDSGRDNGRLQAWEILDSVHLSAGLVTLSACETALGRPIDGEGLAGLSRIFQLAGARSVVATLWTVSDSSTASFMQTFYQRLRSGESKDRALQAAQAAQIRSSSYSSPFYWAAFQLWGAWVRIDS